MSNSSEALLQEAIHLLETQRFDKVLEAYDKAAIKSSDSVEALLCGAVLLSDLGFYEEAAIRFESAAVLEREYKTHLKGLLASIQNSVTLMCENGLYDPALQMLQSLEEKIPTKEVKILQARVWIHKQESPKAADILETVEEQLNTREEKAFFARVLHLSGKRKKALLELEKIF